MNSEFTFHLLNDEGKTKAMMIANLFDDLLEGIKPLCGSCAEFTITKRKLEEACFYAKKSMANQPNNHAEKNPTV